uniref:Uncharacterized protein n=1 Tax=Salix viminalis TaxID=40686 RepID=A0A6N2KE03_SALVM
MQSSFQARLNLHSPKYTFLRGTLEEIGMELHGISLIMMHGRDGFAPVSSLLGQTLQPNLTWDLPCQNCPERLLHNTFSYSEPSYVSHTDMVPYPQHSQFRQIVSLLERYVQGLQQWIEDKD